METTQDSYLTGGARVDTPVPIIAPGHTFESITDKIGSIVLKQPFGLGWILAFSVALTCLGLLGFTMAMLIFRGVGIWGVNAPVGWGFAIVNFVWWIGIGHAGTLISAILLLFNQHWRTSINRFAEAMTLFAVACAGMYPIFHLGRPWLFYWLFPYPSTMGVWPNFRSALMWDVFAVSTYGTISAVFWFVGLIPDLAALRDRADKIWVKRIFGLLSLGWRSSARHWKRYETAYVLLAGLSTPLVLSVHTIVSFDFAISIMPGWHSTIFPPYFVAGAIYSGFAMVMTIAIPMRATLGLKDFITDRHLNNMAKVMLATGLMVAYGYLMEHFHSWYSHDPYEWYMTKNRWIGPYGPMFWLLMLCNILIPQMLWSHRIRHNTIALWVISIVVNIGMWCERFVIVITSLHRDYLPSSWGMYFPTVYDWSFYIGTMGLFSTAMLLFCRFLPVISIAEMRLLVSGEHRKEGTLGGGEA